MLLPEGLEGGNGIHTRQSKKPVTGLCLQLLDHLLVARAFDDLPCALAVLALVAEDGDASSAVTSPMVLWRRRRRDGRRR